MSDSLWPYGLYSPWNSPGQNTGVGSCSLLQGIFPTQGSNPGLPHCRWILYQLSHKGSPRILEWVAFCFSRGSSQPMDQTQVSRIAGGFFPSWAAREAPISSDSISIKCSEEADLHRLRSVFASTGDSCLLGEGRGMCYFGGDKNVKLNCDYTAPWKAKTIE